MYAGTQPAPNKNNGDTPHILKQGDTAPFRLITIIISAVLKLTLFFVSAHTIGFDTI